MKTLNGKKKNGDVTKLEPSEVDKVRSLKNYKAYQEVKGDFPSHPKDLRHNNITIDDWEDLIRDPTIIIMLEFTADINTNPPPGLAGSSGSSSHQLTPV